MVDLAVVDYGINNLRSATRGLERAGADVDVVETPDALAGADGVVLPGVGAFGDGMENAGPFRAVLTDAAADGTPLLGICLGMQMLLSGSEEAEREGQGDAEGLGVIPGRNVRFRDAPKVPHMGWNDLTVERDHPVLAGVDGEYAYFVHSYYARPDDSGAVAATTAHGERFPAVVASDNVVGTQFHPEKSGETGLRLLENFVAFCAERRA
ncbi:MAG: imidazole glycerol phosphate synthase subunit hisH [uncultured archaeon A07HB70]|nr:MAG: imidazole glycerol phosphate synthase subunit hisH [uncultured archaeon A07HB70]